MRTQLVLAVLLLGCGTSGDDTPASSSASAGTSSAAGRAGTAGVPGTAGTAGVSSGGTSAAGTAGSAAGKAGAAGASGGAGASTAGAGGGGQPTTTIRVHYPTTKNLTLRGDHGGLSWTTGVPLTKSGDAWTLTTTAIDTQTEVKPLIEDATWSKGPNFKVKPGTTIDVYPRFETDKGKLVTLDPAFSSPKLPDARAVWAYLPPTYVENAAFQAPVLYMHDGQNVFGQPGAFGDWKAQATMDAGAASGEIDETIVIGIANTQARLDEYTPTFDATEGFGGKGDLYLSLILEDLKPRVDQSYRTRPGRETTSMLGSSLGGLISAYAGVKHGGTFGVVGAMSPSTWWDGLMLVDVVKMSPAQKSIRVYVDSGDAGPSNDGVADTKLLAEAYAKLGYVEGKDLHYVVEAGGQHNEASWAKRLPSALAFMLGPRADLR